MMRKDVRIGFAIGGVLLAVLIVYGLVTSGPAPRNHEVTLAPDDPAANSSNANRANQTTADKKQPSGDTAAQTPGSGEASRQTDATAGNSTSPRGNDSVAGAGNGPGAANPADAPTTAPSDKWERALNHGVMMAKSETPSPNSPGVPAAQSNQDNTTAQPAQPPAATEGTKSGTAGTSGTHAGEVTPGAPDTATGTDQALNNAGTGTGTGTGAIDARVLADIAAGGNGSAAPGGNASTGGSSSSAPAPLNTSVNATGQRTHVVQPNETFASIAEVAYGSQAYYPHVVRANPNVNPKKLRAGMTIVLPDKEQVVAKDAKPQGTALVSSSAAAAPGATGSTGSTGTTGATHLSGNPSAAVTVALPPIDERTQYRVQAGESLYKISLKLYGRGDKVNAIYDLNKDAIGANRNHLKAGTVLKLPDPPSAGATAAR